MRGNKTLLRLMGLMLCVILTAGMLGACSAAELADEPDSCGDDGTDVIVSSVEPAAPEDPAEYQADGTGGKGAPVPEAAPQAPAAQDTPATAPAEDTAPAQDAPAVDTKAEDTADVTADADTEALPAEAADSQPAKAEDESDTQGSSKAAGASHSTAPESASHSASSSSSSASSKAAASSSTGTTTSRQSTQQNSASSRSTASSSSSTHANSTTSANGSTHMTTPRQSSSSASSRNTTASSSSSAPQGPVCSGGHHVYPTDWVVTRQPTCTQSGSKSRTCQCGATAQSTSFGSPTGVHVWQHKETAPSCTLSGSSYDVCKTCGAKRNVVTTPALGHNYVTHEDPATCSHTGSRYEECTNCHKVINRVTLPKKAHTWGETITVGQQTCTTSSYEYRVCTVCGAESEKCHHPSTGGHKFVIDGTRSTYGTCTEAGTIVEVCTVCGAENYRTDPAFGFHQWVEQSRVYGTCQHEGSVTYECALCHATKTESTPITDHRWVLNDNCIGLKCCADCGLEFSEDLYG